LIALKCAEEAIAAQRTDLREKVPRSWKSRTTAFLCSLRMRSTVVLLRCQLAGILVEIDIVALLD
jgi:hypothetical protein